MDIKKIIESTPDRVEAIKTALANSPTRPDYSNWMKALAIAFRPVDAMSEMDALACAMRMATLGMDPSPAAGHVNLIKRGGVYRLEEGYKFRLYLLHLAGWTTETHTVNKGEDCRIVVRGGRSEINHSYSLGQRDPEIEASYCITERVHGGKVQRFVALVDNNQLRRIKQTANAWAAGPEAMAKKAAVHRLRHTMPIEALGLSAAATSALAELDSSELDGVFMLPASPSAAAISSMSDFYALYDMTPDDIDAAEAEYPSIEDRKAFIKANFDLKQ